MSGIAWIRPRVSRVPVVVPMGYPVGSRGTRSSALSALPFLFPSPSPALPLSPSLPPSPRSRVIKSLVIFSVTLRILCRVIIYYRYIIFKTTPKYIYPQASWCNDTRLTMLAHWKIEYSIFSVKILLIACKYIASSVIWLSLLEILIFIDIRVFEFFDFWYFLGTLIFSDRPILQRRKKNLKSY